MLDAAKAMKLSAKDLLELQIIDEIITEPLVELIEIKI
jgi:acetyl-CoA carboxylase carboxyl transferase subunit alpha